VIITDLQHATEYTQIAVVFRTASACSFEMKFTTGWLRHYATSWKVVGSIPGEVIGFFN
jgi:hypothetical protein